MPTTIKLKNSVTTTNAPSSLVQGEVAINITDKKVWVGNAATTPIQLLGDGGSVNFTTVDTTNLQVTNIKAKDGTASASIANSTGALTVAAAFAANGGTTLGDASGDALTINSSAVSIPNGLNFDSNTLVIDAANNRVGVGTASPSTTLHINGNAILGAEVYRSSATSFMRIAGGTEAAGANLIVFGESHASAAGRFSLNAVGTGFMDFSTGGAERMRITSTGDVGIGTSSPSQKLHVLGNALVTSSAGGGYLQLGTSVANQYQQLNLGGVNNGDNGWIVGKADTSGAIAPSLGLFIYDLKNSSTRMVIDTSGNVGIGTSSPNTTASNRVVLEVNGTTSALLNISGGGTRRATLYADSTDCVFGSITSIPLEFLTGGVERMRIDSSGNVLVGITSARANAGDVQVSKGISFPATQSAQSDANTLDDYEEGTWTPAVGNQTVTGSFSSNGTYTKIGRQVFFRGQVIGSTSIAGTAGTYIGGLPFTSTASGTGSGTIANQTAGAIIFIGPSDTNVYIIGGYAATGNFEFSGMYFV
jgi:hypothetical protein